MIKKLKILFYSGHCETVGGDSKYLFELINNINQNKYEAVLFTDKNHIFKERAKQYLSKNIPIKYLNTWPVLFKKNHAQILYEKIAERKNNGLFVNMSSTLLNRKIFGHSIYRWMKYIYFKVARVVSLTQLRHNIHNVLIFYRLFKTDNKDIDIFHFNNGGYPAKDAGLIGVIVAHFCGIKRIIVSIHNVPGNRKWYRISDYIFDILISKYCEIVIVASKNIRKEINHKRTFPLAKIVVIPCGLDDIRKPSEEEIINKKKELNLKMDVPIISITGNLDEYRKGHTVLFKSLIEIKKKYPNIILLIVGDGKRKVELMTLNREYKLDDNITFLGYREDIEEINSIIDIAVVPSIGFEATPYTIKEAMRAGKPVIVTNAGGCDEAVEDNINGLIISQNNVESLTKSVLQLLGDEALRIKMGNAGRDIFLNKFLLADKIFEHERIYDQLFIENCC